jgi:4-diphosphocytidyl-2-C-methyl-D-erythritol kinase
VREDGGQPFGPSSFRDAVRREAHAKINVFLRVLGRRDDGYHDLESLVVPVSLADAITVAPADGLWLTVRGETAHGVPSDRSNLAARAMERLLEACPDGSRGAAIEIVKRIPVAAGLGGGSADAAAAILALHEVWRCGLSQEELASVAADVGSDVPALMSGGPVVMRGRGEVVEPAQVRPTWWVLVRQAFRVRTPDAYAWWDADGGATGPDPEPVLEAAQTGDPAALGPILFNDLEEPVATRHPEVANTKERLLEAGAAGAVMSGSGPTVAALATGEHQAERMAAAFPGSIAVTAPPAHRPDGPG